MPGNRKEVRTAVWYDLIAQGLDRAFNDAALHMQTVPPPDGVVKRYTRRADVMPPVARRARRVVVAPTALPAWLRDNGRASRRWPSRCCGLPMAPTMTASDCSAATRRSCARRRCMRGIVGASAVAIAAGHSRRAARGGGDDIISRATRTTWTADEQRRVGRAGAGDHCRCALRSSVRAGQPRGGCRSSAACRSRRVDRLVSGQIDRLVVTPQRRVDRRLQDQPHAAARSRAAFRRPMSGNWPCIARC